MPMAQHGQDVMDQMDTRKDRCLSMASFFLASSWLCLLYTITRSAFFQNCITCRIANFLVHYEMMAYQGVLRLTGRPRRPQT